MNVPVKLPDSVAVDARGGRSAKAGTPAAANDDGSQSFDGALSDVGSGDAPSKTEPSGASPSNDPTTGDPSQTVTDDASLEALMEFVGQAQIAPGSAAATALRSTKPTDKTSDAEESVDALLKRIAKKDDDAKNAGDDPTTTAPTESDPRLDALTTLVAQIAPLAAAPAVPAPTAGGKDGHPPQAPVQAGADVATGPSQVVASGAIVSDISIETHLALAPNRPDGRAAPASHGAATTSENASLEASATPSSMHDALARAAASGSGRGDGGGQDSPSGHSEPETAKAEAAKTEGVVTAPMLAADFGSLRRIASAVVELAAAPAATNAAVPDADAQSRTAAPARTLTLQMQPADLGTVDVRLHMSSDGLDLRLGISDERTLGMVSRERDTLTNLLQDQNYQVHSLVIQESGGTSSGGFSGNHNPSPQSEARADRQPGAAGSEGQGTSQRQQQGERPAHNGRQPSDTPSPRPSADPGTSLFV